MKQPIQNLHDDRQLFITDSLIDHTTAQLRANPPIPRGIVMTYDESHEAGGAIYHQIFKDGDVYRMFYKAAPLIHHYVDASAVLCYAESRDGIRWEKPKLGLVECNGSMDNNIVLSREMLFCRNNRFLEEYCKTLPESRSIPREKWIESLTDANSPDLDTFTICMDPRSDCPPDERFKALTPLSICFDNMKMPAATTKKWMAVLYAFKSSDGFHWERLQDLPVMGLGAYDSMNVSFWDKNRQQFWAYIRGFHGDNENHNLNVRDVRWCISKDYRNWSNPVLLDFGEAEDIPLYTSSVQPYLRAQQYFMGFPTRYIDRHQWSSSYDYLPDPDMRRERMINLASREGTAITDCAMMASNDGKTWHRYDEAFLRPGVFRSGSWVYGDCYPAWPLVETPEENDTTAPNELSLYAPERTRVEGEVRLRRFSIRLDGFVSLNATTKPCETVINTFTFTGRLLSINFSTSAAGWMRFELQDADSAPIMGYTLTDCDEIFGDVVDRPVLWNGSADISELAGKPIRMRIVMSDSDLFSFKFEL